MALRIKSYVVVGIRFSDLCVPHKTETINGSEVFYTYRTPTLERELAKKFEDGEIDPKEVTPELLALTFSLNEFEYQGPEFVDAIIGIKIIESDAGNKNQNMTDIKDVEIARAKVLSHLKDIDPKIAKEIKIEIAIITKIEEIETK